MSLGKPENLAAGAMEELPMPSYPTKRPVPGGSGASPFNGAAPTLPTFVVPQQAPTQSASKRCASLELLYGAVPAMLEESTCLLRIERIEPQWFNDENGVRQRVGGFLGYERQAMSTEQFAFKYGGYKYRVAACVEKSPPSNRGGPPAVYEVAEAVFEVPLDPQLDWQPVGEMSGMSMFMRGRPSPNMWPQTVMMPQQQSGGSEVAGQVLDFAKAFIPQQGNQGNQDRVFETLQQNARDTVQSTRDVLMQQAERERQLVEEERRRNEQLQREIADMRRQPPDSAHMMTAMAQVIGAMKGSASSDEMKAIMENHHRELQRLNEQHAQEVTRINEMNRMQAEVLRAQHSESLRIAREETASREVQAQRERDRDREDYNRREDQARRSAEDDLKRQKEFFESRIASIEDSHKRELRNAEERFKMVRETTDIAGQVTRGAIERELSMLKEEVVRKSGQLEEWNAEKNKPLLAQIQEAQQTVEQIQALAGGPAEGAEGGSTMEKVIAGLSTVAGPVLERIMAQKPQVAPLPQPQQVHQLPQHQVQHRPMPQQRPMPQRRPAPRPFVFSDDPDMSRDHQMGPQEVDNAPVFVPPVPRQTMPPQPRPSMPPPQQVVYSQPPPRPSQPPPMQQPVQSQAPQQVAPPAQQAAPPVPGPEEDPWTGLEWLPVEAQERAALIGQLVQAFEQNVSPQEVASKIIAENPAVAPIIPVAIPIDRLLEGLTTAAATRETKLASTARGKRFLRKIWALLEQSKPAEATAEEPEKEEEVADA